MFLNTYAVFIVIKYLLLFQFRITNKLIDWN